jgi:hypothetical protein
VARPSQLHDGDALPVSDRLAQVLLVYADPANGTGYQDLHHAVRDGHYPWLEPELSECLSANSLTCDQWARLTGQADTEVTAATVAEQQQRLWRIVFPAKAYPLASGVRAAEGE